MRVGGIDAAGFGTSASDITDSSGRVSMRVQFTNVVGAGWVAISVPLLELTDTG
jgi:hypothetical protein